MWRTCKPVAHCQRRFPDRLAPSNAAVTSGTDPADDFYQFAMHKLAVIAQRGAPSTPIRSGGPVTGTVAQLAELASG